MSVLVGERNRYAFSCHALQSSADMSTALPLRETISTASRSSFTRSMSGNRSLRASLSLLDISRPGGTTSRSQMSASVSTG